MGSLYTKPIVSCTNNTSGLITVNELSNNIIMWDVKFSSYTAWHSASYADLARPPCFGWSAAIASSQIVNHRDYSVANDVCNYAQRGNVRCIVGETTLVKRCKKDNRQTRPHFDVSTPSTEWIFDLHYRDAQRISLYEDNLSRAQCRSIRKVNRKHLAFHIARITSPAGGCYWLQWHRTRTTNLSKFWTNGYWLHTLLCSSNRTLN